MYALLEPSPLAIIAQTATSPVMAAHDPQLNVSLVPMASIGSEIDVWPPALKEVISTSPTMPVDNVTLDVSSALPLEIVWPAKIAPSHLSTDNAPTNVEPTVLPAGIMSVRDALMDSSQ